ncbi:UNVERIFIED_CONTAM: hypothetical protein Sindi_1385700 [Sesamum indicum]
MFLSGSGGEPGGASKLTDGPNFAHGWSYAASSICTRSSLRAPRRGQLGSAPRCAPSRPPKISHFGRIPGAVFHRPSRSVGPVGPIRPESDMGSLGPFWESGVREGERKNKKKKDLTTGRSGSQKGYYSRPSTLSFGVLMGSGALVLAAGGSPEGASKLTDGPNFAHGWSYAASEHIAREALSELHDVDNWAPPRCAPSRPPKSAISGRIPGPFSIGRRVRWARGPHSSGVGHGVPRAVFGRAECAKGKEKNKKKKDLTTGRSGSQKGVQHEDFPGGSGGEPGGASKLTDGLTLRTGGVTRRAAYAREALSELHDVDNWGSAPVVPHLVPQNQPISGAFRGRFPSAVAFGGPVAPFVRSSDMGSLGPFWESGVREGERKKQEEERL